MIHWKNMVDAAIKPRQLTSTGKKLQDQLLKKGSNRSIQQTADSQWLDESGFLCSTFFLAYTKYSAYQSQQLKLTSLFHR